MNSKLNYTHYANSNRQGNVFKEAKKAFEDSKISSLL